MTTTAAGLAHRTDAVLVLIDIQERLAAAMAEREDVVRAATRMARSAALVGVPVVFTRQYPQGLGPTDAELESTLLRLAEDGATVLGVDKTAFCCVSEPDFLDVLKATGRNQTVLAGMETHICVTQTALELSSLGYHVQVAGDACCSRARSMHDLALDRMRAAGIVVTSSESVMYELVERAATDEFRHLLEIVKG